MHDTVNKAQSPARIDLDVKLRAGFRLTTDIPVNADTLVELRSADTRKVWLRISPTKREATLAAERQGEFVPGAVISLPMTLGRSANYRLTLQYVGHVLEIGIDDEPAMAVSMLEPSYSFAWLVLTGAAEPPKVVPAPRAARLPPLISTLLEARTDPLPDHYQSWITALRAGQVRFNFIEDYIFSYCLKYRALYASVPKCASSAVYQSVIQAVNSAAYADSWRHDEIHDYYTRQGWIRLKELSADQLQDILFGPDTFRFTVVRSPFQRLLSCYLDKIVSFGPGYSVVLHALRKKDPERWAGQQPAVTFADFVEAIGNIAPPFMEIHFRPQWTIVLPDLVPYQLIGRVESFDQDWEKIRHKTGMPGYLTASGTTHKTGSAAKLKEYYTDELIGRVSEIYSLDFSILGYSKNPY